MANKTKLKKKHVDKFISLGLNIAYYRRKIGLTQEDLADIIDVNRSHISKIEAPNMDTQISLCLLFDVAEALDVDVAKLFEER